MFYKTINSIQPPLAKAQIFDHVHNFFFFSFNVQGLQKLCFTYTETIL